MNLANGLLGLGGFNGIGGTQPQLTGLLGQYYNPQDLKKAKLKAGLLNAGIALLSQKPELGQGIGTSLGAALRGGAEGAQQAQADYMQNAMMGYSMDRQAKDDAWQAKTRERQQHAWDSEDQANEARKAFYSALPEDQRKLAEAYPDQFGQLYLQNSMSSAKPTDDMSEYHLAQQQGFKGSFIDYQNEVKGSGSGWTSVTTNDGVWAVNSKDPTQRYKIGDRPDRNEGEGRDFTQEKSLREAYVKEAKPFSDLRTNYSRIKAANQDNTGASDIAMVYSFMKMLDPTSVVREGEFATTENAGGVPQQIQSLYNKVINGQRLTPEVRQQFVQQADRQYQEQYNTYKQIQSTYVNLAKQYNLDPAKVAPDLEYGVMPGSGTSPLTSPLVTPNGQTRKYNPLTGKLE